MHGSTRRESTLLRKEANEPKARKPEALPRPMTSKSPVSQQGDLSAILRHLEPTATSGDTSVLIGVSPLSQMEQNSAALARLNVSP